MSGARVQIQGDERLSRKLDAAAAAMADIGAMSAEGARAVADAARPATPRLTGALAATVRAGATGRVGYVSAGGGAVPYAGVIHYGLASHGIEAQPWIEDTAWRMEPEIIQVFQEEIERAVRDCEGGP